MGAWGADTFDNDMAGDWADGLEDQQDLSYVRDTLRQVIESEDEYLDSDDACAALAACETIARLKGHWGKKDAASETVDDWVKAHPQPVPADLVTLAVTVIERALDDDSELKELWEESDESYAEWTAAVADLRRRVET